MTQKYPPAHLEADTPEELRKLMFKNNAKHKRMFHYFDFTFAKNKWHCWYEISLQDSTPLTRNNEDT